jgi:uncharacterized protein (TIGR03083 family)
VPGGGFPVSDFPGVGTSAAGPDGELGHLVAAFQHEMSAFIAALRDLPASLWDRPTRCEPWQVRDVVGHVITVLARVPDMVAASAPSQADTDPITYYRGDQRFSDTTNADRVRSAHRRAAVSDVTALGDDLAAITRDVVTRCTGQPADRLVRTRHGDAMLLSDFLVTRLFEAAVHGIDVADAVERPPWLTVSAANHLGHMLFGTDSPMAITMLGGDAAIALRKATGRSAVTDDERALLTAWGIHRLTLG